VSTTILLCLNNIVGTPTWNRTKINEFKARCDSHYTMREQNKQDVFLRVELKVQCINFAVNILKLVHRVGIEPTTYAV